MTPEEQTRIDRQLDYAFRWIRAALDDPSLLDDLPERGVISFDPEGRPLIAMSEW